MWIWITLLAVIIIACINECYEKLEKIEYQLNRLEIQKRKGG
jgi:hypothetical protein